MKTSSPLHIRLAAVILGWWALSLNSSAQVPGLLNYQGKVSIGATPFTGTGQFKFALVNATGTTTFWSNDGSSTAGAAPAAAVSLPVVNGLYFVQLGDTTLANMVTLPHAVFQNADVRLRVWFDDGAHGFEQITPDQRIAAVGYAMMAGTVQDGAITSSKIAAGAVQSSHIASGAVGSAQIAAGAVGSTQIVSGAIQSSNIANGAVGSAQIAAGAVGTAQIAPGAITATQMANQFSAGAVSFTNDDFDFGVAAYDVTFPTAFDELPIITQTVASSNSETPSAALWTHSKSKTGFTGRLDVGRPTASRVVNLDPTITSVGPAGMDACVIDGTKCMVYFFPNSSQFLFTRSFDDDGTSWSTAQRVDIRLSSEQDDNDPIVITAISLIQNGTIPEVFVGVVDKTGNGMRSQVRYIFGNLNGSPWYGTTRMADVNYNQTFRYITSVKAFKANGKLEFLAYARTFNGFEILHARNIDASTPGSGGWRYWSALTGTAPTIPITQDPPDPPAFSSCLLSDGMPAILYQNNTGALRFFRATTLDESNAQAYSYSFLIPDVATGAAPLAQMALVDDEPAVVYVDKASGDLQYRRSNGGTTWPAPLELDGSGTVSNLSFKYMPIGFGGIYPQVAYVRGGTLYYMRANDRTGTNWRPPVVIDSKVNVDSSGYAGSPTLIQSPGGTIPQLYYFKGDLSDIYFMSEAFSYPSISVNWIAIEP